MLFFFLALQLGCKGSRRDEIAELDNNHKYRYNVIFGE